MNREFLIAYRAQRPATLAQARAEGLSLSGGNAMLPEGDIILKKVEAPGNRGEAEAFVRRIFAQFHIDSLEQLRIVLDPHQNIFEKEEAAEYLRCSVDQIGKYMSKGWLPRSREGYPKFSRRMLDGVLEKIMGDGELKEAA